MGLVTSTERRPKPSLFVFCLQYSFYFFIIFFILTLSFFAAQPTQRFQLYTFGPVVGAGDNDYSGLWRHRPQNVPGHDRGHPLCSGWRVDCGTTGSRHRVKFCHVLFTHAGPRQASQETKAGCQCRTPSGGSKGARWQRRGWQRRRSQNG